MTIFETNYDSSSTLKTLIGKARFFRWHMRRPDAKELVARVDC